MKIKRKERCPGYVGYKHPPFKTRWRKGQSGNPHGRPKKDDSLRGIAEQELRREVLLRENGQARRVSLKVAIIKRCLADAAQGKIRNLEFLVKLLNQTVPVQADTELTPAEQELWNSYFKQTAVRERFSVFLHRVFLEVDNSQNFTPNWHLEVVADKLLAVERGDIDRLIITQPLRSLKSICASVAFPAWILGHNPRARIICISYSQELADKFGRQTRQVMESSWYKASFPGTRINPAKRADSEFETTARGFRLATSIGGRLTGLGGQYLIIDDPIKPNDAMSRVQRKNVNDWFSSTLYSRLDNKNTGRILLVIMQRVHEEDLMAHVQQLESWEELRLQAVDEQDETFTLRNGRVLKRKAGEVLNSSLDNIAKLEEIKNTLGNYNFQAQYQQNPIPEKGNVINFDWFKRYTELPKDEKGRIRIIQSWDTAMTEHDGSDYSVCITAQVINKQYYIRDVFRKRLLFPDLVKEVKRLKSKYNAREVFIEDKASGVELIQLLRRQGFPGIQAIKPEGSKEDRIAAQSSLVENGRVFIPESAPWIEELKREVNAFPRGAHDDQLDVLAQLLKREEEIGDKLGWLAYV